MVQGGDFPSYLRCKRHGRALPFVQAYRAGLRNQSDHPVLAHQAIPRWLLPSLRALPFVQGIRGHRRFRVHLDVLGCQVLHLVLAGFVPEFLVLRLDRVIRSFPVLPWLRQILVGRVCRPLRSYLAFQDVLQDRVVRPYPSNQVHRGDQLRHQVRAHPWIPSHHRFRAFRSVRALPSRRRVRWRQAYRTCPSSSPVDLAVRSLP